MALDPDGAVTQSVTTGGNELANDAAIVDVNPDATYVEGQIYTDSILVQADLVPTDSDQRGQRRYQRAGDRTHCFRR